MLFQKGSLLQSHLCQQHTYRYRHSLCSVSPCREFPLRRYAVYCLWRVGAALISTGRPNAVKSIWQEVARVCMSEKTCFSFVNAWHVTSSLLLSDVILVHTECCAENKFSSSPPPGLLWFGMKGGETVHGHFHTVHVRHRYVFCLLLWLSLI